MGRMFRVVKLTRRHKLRLEPRLGGGEREGSTSAGWHFEVCITMYYGVQRDELPA
jgi:hypothetical protein